MHAFWCFHGQDSPCISIAKLLQEKGARISEPTDEVSRMSFSVESLLQSQSDLLLSYQHVSFACISQGVTPLHVAAALAHADLCLWLVEAKAKVNAVTATTREAPLHRMAASVFDPEQHRPDDIILIVEVLCQGGANVKQLDANGATPLYVAAECGNVAMVDALLRAKCSPVAGLKNNSKAPMHAAAMNGHVQAMRSLRKEGASVNTPSEFGLTPLQYAIMFAPPVPGMVTYIINLGARLHETSKVCMCSSAVPTQVSPALLFCLHDTAAFVRCAVPGQGAHCDAFCV